MYNNPLDQESMETRLMIFTHFHRKLSQTAGLTSNSWRHSL